jgi:hypothetical protein
MNIYWLINGLGSFCLLIFITKAMVTSIRILFRGEQLVLPGFHLQFFVMRKLYGKTHKVYIKREKLYKEKQMKPFAIIYLITSPLPFVFSIISLINTFRFFLF